MRKCEKCGVEFAEDTTHTCATPETVRTDCPECGATFKGDQVLHASEKLATLSEQNAALTGELEATKKKLADAEARIAETSTEDAPAAEQKRKRRPIFGASKRAAA